MRFFPGKLCADVGIVWQRIEGSLLVLLREQQLHEHLVGDVLRQRSADPGPLRRIQDFADGVVGPAQFRLHGVHTLVRVSGHPQDVSVVEQMKFLYNDKGAADCRDGVAVFP